MTFLIYDVTGRAVSIGTVVADPLPAGLTAVALADADAAALGTTRQWDASTRTVIDRNPEAMPPSLEDRLAAVETEVRGIKERAAATAVSNADAVKVRDAVAGQ